MKLIDISSNNHSGGETFNFLQVKEAGYDGVYVKATQGDNYLNPYLIGDVRDAANNGLLVGVYHFYDLANGTPEQQAAWFLKNGIQQPEEAGRTLEDFCTLLPVLDYEVTNTRGERDAFLSALQRQCGVYCTRSIEQAIGYGAAAFGWLAWPGWAGGLPLPAGTAIVQTGQELVQGIPLACDVDQVIDAAAIDANQPVPTPAPTPLPTQEKEEDMIESVLVMINGVQKMVTTIIVPGNEHVVQMVQTVNDLGLPATDANTQIIDITDAFPPQVPA
jgi:hypothetical protein